jgi:hypothetical protein
MVLNSRMFDGSSDIELVAPQSPLPKPWHRRTLGSPAGVFYGAACQVPGGEGALYPSQ